jgi:hypothetical protein
MIQAHPFAVSLLTVVLGVATALFVMYVNKLTSLPEYAQFKKDYPVINVALKFATEKLVGSPAGVLAQIAYALYESRGLTPQEVNQYALAAADAFDLDKYVSTNWEGLSEAQLQEGYEIAVKAFPALAEQK